MVIRLTLTVPMQSCVKTEINMGLVCWLQLTLQIMSHTLCFGTYLFSFVWYIEVFRLFLRVPSVYVMGWPELMWGLSGSSTQVSARNF